MPDRLKSTGKRNPLPYGRGNYAPGEEFTAPASDARTLVMTGLAIRVGPDEQPQELAPAIEPLPLLTRAFVAQGVEDPPKRKRGRPRKGEYDRRDMRAKE
jgi:hypothetical protein